MYRKYENQGFEVLGFPCNQFGSRPPKEIGEYIEICQLKYCVKFEQFNKIDVNGPQTIELYKYLKKQLPNAVGKEDVLWNFEKFLVDRDGKVVKRFVKDHDLKDVNSLIGSTLKSIIKCSTSYLKIFKSSNY